MESGSAFAGLPGASAAPEGGFRLWRAVVGRAIIPCT